MNEVVLALFENFGGSAPFVCIAIGGLYFALKNQMKMTKQLEKNAERQEAKNEKFELHLKEISEELVDVKNELHKVNLFYCDKTQCKQRHPELGTHETKH